MIEVWLGHVIQHTQHVTLSPAISPSKFYGLDFFLMISTFKYKYTLEL